MFCALHDQLASLGRHAQLMRCFSAVAELLVSIVLVGFCVYFHRGKLSVQYENYSAGFLQCSDFLALELRLQRNFSTCSRDLANRAKENLFPQI